VKDRRGPAPGWVALTLAIGLATALNLFVVAILYDALFHTTQAGVSENAVQILTGWGGGIVGIIGGYVGYVAGEQRSRRQDGSDDRGGQRRTDDPGATGGGPAPG
jgi:hypothetical protein